jgi:hypothetical protein
MRRLLWHALMATTLIPVSPASSAGLWDRFVNPPADARPMVRWWWFGPAVEDREIDREIAAMKAGGFGGFEVQPTYPLTLDDPGKGRANLPYLSDAFLARLSHAGATARAENMRIDVTIGTGWPFGGPHVPVSEAASAIRRVALALPAGADKALLPPMVEGETVLAAFLGTDRLMLADGAAVLSLPATSPRTLTLYIAGRTGQQVKRPAVGGEGFVIDHVDAGAVTHHLAAVGDRLLTAFPKDAPPYAMFSDSLEAYGSSWTGDLPTIFRARRGYDLLDHLPALFEDKVESPAVRSDWAQTLSELVDERYLTPIDHWAKVNGTRFRAQVYGYPPPTLSSNALVALPEGEGADWRRFTDTRWASSAAHLYARPVVSSETWTWLHSPTWAATPIDMKAEADRHFLQGINQLVGHGWPYSAPGAAEPGWAFYAAASLNDHNPWYGAMPAVTGYLTRVSAMLREGQVANRIVLYLPIEDAFAGLTPDKASADKALEERITPALVGRILDAGYGFDFIDAGAVKAGKLGNRVLVLPGLGRIDLAAWQMIGRWAEKGGKIVSVGPLPTISGGLLDGAPAGRRVAAINRAIRHRVRIVTQDELGAALRASTMPDMTLDIAVPALGVVHRRLDGGDLYFLVNTGNVSVDTRARFPGTTGAGSWWDAVSGQRYAAGVGAIHVRLAPYESRFLLFGGGTGMAAPAPEPHAIRDLSQDWTLQVGRHERHLDTVAPWTDTAADRSFSGAAVYRHDLDLSSAPNGRLWLDFGTPAPTEGRKGERPRAFVTAPVREAAIVTINGKAAGTLWTAPYRLEVTGLLKTGVNHIEVAVMNTALNALAARGPADLRLVTLRYGERFTNQDQDLVIPQTSGLTGPITLLGE